MSALPRKVYGRLRAASEEDLALAAEALRREHPALYGRRHVCPVEDCGAPAVTADGLCEEHQG